MAREEEDSTSLEVTQSRIVVGVDGSTSSGSALRWAAREARLRGAILEVVHATLLIQDAMELDAAAALRKRESEILDESVAEAAALAPGIVIDRLLGEPPRLNCWLRSAKTLRCWW